MATINDVARAANVSAKTVSRVVNNEGRVAEATCQRVREAIARLGYVPNISAQRLRRGRAQAFTLILPRVESPYAARLLRCVLAEARQWNYSVLVIEADPNEPIGRERIERTIGRRQSDGLLIAPPGANTSELVDSVTANRIPCVVITPNHAAPYSVEATDRAGAQDMTRYLISLGHRRIAHISCGSERFAQERLAGYRDALAQAGLPVEERLVCCGDTQAESGFVDALRLLQLPERPTAIFAANDEMAIGAVAAAWQLGLRVPDEVSIAGFDDMPIARLTSPPLTTVCQPVDQIARAAVEMLIRLINQQPIADAQVQIPTRLVIRQSCAAQRPDPNLAP